jgi:AraC family transcriptional regulator, transcriptional activator of pobA
MIKVQHLHTKQRIYIETIEEQSHDVINSEPHTHDFLEIGFFETGQGLHTIDFNTYTIEPCTVYFLTKGNVHTMFRKKGSKGKVILFDENILPNNDVLKKLFFALPQYTLSQENFAAFQQLVQQLQLAMQNTSNGTALITQYIQTILIFFETYSIKKTSNSEKINLFLAYVEDHYSAKLTVQECAKNLFIPYQQLHQELQQKLHKTPMQIIQERIILQAKRLLYNTQDTMQEIAYSLGFEDASYFSKYFKNHCAEAPLLFRKKSRE